MKRESYFRAHRPSVVICLASLFGFLISASAVEIAGFDLWWHLAIGRAMSMLGQILRYDLFSYTAFGAPWVNQEWLFQLLQWRLFDLAGTDGLIAVRVLMAAAISLLLFRTIDFLSRSRNLAIWGAVLFIWSSSYRMMDRPFFLGMLFLAAFCLVLHRYVRDGTRAIWALPLLQVLWINCHGGGLLGPMILFAFAFGETMQALLRQRLGGPEPLGWAKIRALWLVGFASLAACALNPWGIDIFPLYLELNRATTILSFTDEWLPLLHPELDMIVPPAIALAVAAASLASFAANASRIRFSSLMLAAGTMFLLARGHRFVPEMTLVNLPLMMQNFAELRRKPGQASNVACWINVAAAFAISAMTLAFGIPMKFEHRLWSRPGRGVAYYSAPANLIKFLDEYGIKGRVLNDMGLGGYLMLTRWPGERVFIDGRTPIYGDSFFKEFIEAFRNSRNFEELIRKYDIDYILLPGYRAWDQGLLHKYLWGHPEWRLVFGTNEGFVYLRDRPKFKKLIQELALDKNPAIEMIERVEKGIDRL
ncbi:MAG: hypothetical protein WC683_18995 [bacterium]